MNKFIFVLLCSLSSLSLAASGGHSYQSDTGIITPDVATGFKWFNNYNIDTNGDLVVCIHPTRFEDDGCAIIDKKHSWRRVADVVPKGRTYVGFRVVSRDYGHRQLEVYFK